MTGGIILIQDADLEYSVEDYPKLIAPIMRGEVDFTLGCRHVPGRTGARDGRDARFVALVMNSAHWAFTWFFNITYGTKLRDPFTMYKVFRSECIEGVEFVADRFDFDWELAAKLVRLGYKPIEIPIEYNARSFHGGKKVRFFRDPPTWIAACLRFRFCSLPDAAAGDAVAQARRGGESGSATTAAISYRSGPAMRWTADVAGRRASACGRQSRSRVTARRVTAYGLRSAGAPEIARTPSRRARLAGRVRRGHRRGARLVPRRPARLLTGRLRRSHAQRGGQGGGRDERASHRSRASPRPTTRPTSGPIKGPPPGQFEPWAEVTHRAYADGEVPLWNPYQGAGAPHAANMQSAVFDPLLLAVNLHPTPLTWDLSIVGAFVLGAAAAYLFGRILGLRVVPAVVASAAFSLSGWFFLYSNNQFSRSYVFLPLLFLLVELALRSRRLLPVFGLGVAVAGNIYVGMPEASFFVLGAAAVYAAVRLVQERSGCRSACLARPTRRRGPARPASCLAAPPVVPAVRGPVVQLHKPDVRRGFTGRPAVGPPQLDRSRSSPLRPGSSRRPRASGTGSASRSGSRRLLRRLGPHGDEAAARLAVPRARRLPPRQDLRLRPARLGRPLACRGPGRLPGVRGRPSSPSRLRCWRGSVCRSCWPATSVFGAFSRSSRIVRRCSILFVDG